MDLAQRIRRARERAGLTVEALAAATGGEVSERTITGLETGETTRPRLDTLLALSRVLGPIVISGEDGDVVFAAEREEP